MKIKHLRKRLYLISAIILLIGLGGAVLIYLSAKNDSDGILGYESEGGYVYPVMPEDSKKYLHDLELYGGKANVLMAEFVDWFVSLWRGKSLAFTIACITILTALGFFFAARHLPSDLGTDAECEDNQSRPKNMKDYTCRH